MSQEDSSGVPYSCFGGCGREFDTLDEMVPVPGRGDRSPRHHCPWCAYGLGWAAEAIKDEVKDGQ